jgi:hypothetical protein
VRCPETELSEPRLMVVITEFELKYKFPLMELRALKLTEVRAELEEKYTYPLICVRALSSIRARGLTKAFKYPLRKPSDRRFREERAGLM